MKLVLGVDGGNSKTDYLLHDLSGALIAHLRAGTCSHENLGMDGARREMDGRIAEVLKMAGAAWPDVVASAFGLAGIDQTVQKAALTKIIHDMGFENSVAMNDSFLGIKAGSETGVGVCSVNGTGTSAGGIDARGNWVQVGGLGYLSGDEAGGAFIARRAIRAAYDAAYRFGEPTALLPRLLAMFGCQSADDLHCAVSTKFAYGKDVRPVDITKALFACADDGDAVARGIVEEVADALARSAAGCASRLSFGETVPVTLIGSVWTKGRYQPMIDAFAKGFEAFCGKKPLVHILAAPPAAGSVLWALELATGKVPEGRVREKVFAETRGI